MSAYLDGNSKQKVNSKVFIMILKLTIFLCAPLPPDLNASGMLGNGNDANDLQGNYRQ